MLTKTYTYILTCINVGQTPGYPLTLPYNIKKAFRKDPFDRFLL